MRPVAAVPVQGMATLACWEGLGGVSLPKARKKRCEAEMKECASELS